MRILLVSQMYPGPDAPDLGVFVRQMEQALAERGHELRRAVLDRRDGGRRRFGHLASMAVREARRFRPDVVYAHFLVPTGTIALGAARAAGAPLVLTAHGRDVRNIGAVPGIASATRATARRAAAVIAVSRFLRDELVAKVPGIGRRIEVIDCGVDVQRFRGRDADAARAEVGWEGPGPYFLCVGSLDERKNVVRLADAFERYGSGQLAFVGDGPLRTALEGRSGVRVVGRVEHGGVPTWIAASDVVCQPSVIEPLGQSLLEGMAGERTVLATRVGGPPEFVAPGAGVLIDPLDTDDLARGLGRALALGAPNAKARLIAVRHDIRLQAARVEAVLEEACAGHGSDRSPRPARRRR